MSYVTGNTIKTLREKHGITRKALAEKINVSDKTISKWETNKGLPDIGIVEELAKALGVSLTELLTGDLKTNENTAGEYEKDTVLCMSYLWEYHNSSGGRGFFVLRDQASRTGSGST